MKTRLVGGLAAVFLLVGCAGTGGSSSPAQRHGGGEAPGGPLAQASSAPGAGCHYRQAASGQTLPDPSCTPGVTNPTVSQANIGSTICVRGWTKTIRPPASVTEPQKLESMRRYGASGPAGTFEFDHLIPLELGGAPDDRRNLWPEPDDNPRPGVLNSKDLVENAANRAVCAGRLPLAQAQQEMAASWPALGHALGVK